MPKDIVDLLRYDEDTAAELCTRSWLRSMKIETYPVKENAIPPKIFQSNSIYVVDDEDRPKGRFLITKDLLTNFVRTPINDAVYICKLNQ
jgi:hypothetical protein